MPAGVRAGWRERKSLLGSVLEKLGDVRTRREGVTFSTSSREERRRENWTLGKTAFFERSQELLECNLITSGWGTGNAVLAKSELAWRLRITYGTETLLLGSVLRTKLSHHDTTHPQHSLAGRNTGTVEAGERGCHCSFSDHSKVMLFCNSNSLVQMQVFSM